MLADFQLVLRILLQDNYFKKTQKLENLANLTCHEAEEPNWQHSTALWSAGNFTVKESFRRVWTVVSPLQVVFSQKVGRLRNNFASMAGG